MQRARYAVAAAWLVAALLSLAAVTGVFGTKLNDLLSNRFDLPGTESEHARTLLADHFGQRPDSAFTIVFAGGIAPAAQAAGARSAPRAPCRTAASARCSRRGPAAELRADRHAPRAAARRAARRADAPSDRRGGRRPRLRQRAGGDQPRPPARLRRRSAARRGDRDPDRRARAADRLRHRDGDARPAADGGRHGAGHARAAVGRRARDEHGDLRDQPRHADRDRDRDRLLAARRLPLPRGARRRRGLDARRCARRCARPATRCSSRARRSRSASPAWC